MKPVPMPVTAIQFFKTWWPLMGALGSMTVTGIVFAVTLSNRVDGLSQTKADDDLQWLNIRAGIRQGIAHQARLDAIERVVTTQSLEDWGAFKRTVSQDHEALWDHITEHRR